MSSFRPAKGPFEAFAAVAIVCAFALSNTASAYTEKQADDGQIDFNNHCAECHGPTLDGALGPNLHNAAFRKTFANRRVKVLRDYVWQYMPQPTAKSLPDSQLDPIVAWILKNNGVPASGRPLSKASAKRERFTAK